MAATWLFRQVACAGWGGCLSTVAFSLAFPGVAQSFAVQWLPWLFGLFVLGIPHGAFDHRVGSELGTMPEDPPASAAGFGFYLAYLSAVLFVILLWLISPIVALISFLVFAAGHFGQGDVYWSRWFGLATRTDSVGYRVSLMLARSLLPIALPFLAFPREFVSTAGLLSSRLFGQVSWSLPPTVIVLGMAVLISAIVIQVGWATWIAWNGDNATRRLALLDITETLLLIVTFAIVPPVLALGVYFNVWHSPRHVTRLMMICRSTRELVSSGRFFKAFCEFQKCTWPMSCGALVLMSALVLFVGRSLVSMVDVGFVAVVSLSALTLPHVLVVSWMDQRQGVWSHRPAGG
jgi:Brp/Blh family beta-carotene 15,15'-monooxygenase